MCRTINRIPLIWSTLLIGLLLEIPQPNTQGSSLDWMDWDGQRYEEPAGAMMVYEAGDGVGGVGMADGTWLKGSPILGDYFLHLLYNDHEEALYAGVGLTLRLQPRWALAPFIGGGGSYQQVVSRREDRFDELGERKGRSYFAGHAEAGLRWRTSRGAWELLGRYTVSGSDVAETDYPSARLGYGFSF